MFKVSNYNLYQSNRLLVHNISFSIKEGEVLYITGDNGTGKSTFLNKIAQKDFLSSDTIFLKDKNIEAYTIKQWNKTVKLLNQQHSVVFDILVIDFLYLAFRSEMTFYKSISNNHLTLIEEISNQLKIESLLNKSLTELSGGEQQLCWLAQIILQKPELLLLDEPTQYLDVTNRKLFFDFLTTYCKKNKITCICATHDLIFNSNSYQSILLAK